jgi:hypothetical protein
LSSAILAAHNVVHDFYDDCRTPPALRSLVRAGVVGTAPTAGLVSSTRHQHAIIKIPATANMHAEAAYAQWTQQVHSYQVTADAAVEEGNAAVAFPWPVSPPSFASDLRRYMREVREVLAAIAAGIFGPPATGPAANNDIAFARAVAPACFRNVVALSSSDAAELQGAARNVGEPPSASVARVRAAISGSDVQFESAEDRVGSHTDSGVLTAIPVLLNNTDASSSPHRLNVSGLQVRVGDAWRSALDADDECDAASVRLLVMLGEEGAAIADATPVTSDARRAKLEAAVHRVAPDDCTTVAAAIGALGGSRGNGSDVAAANRITLPYQLRGWRPAALSTLDARRSRVTARSLIL